MAITQYSRIQHRRGLMVDLPPVLNTSELGHVVDQQRLFIGNGQLADGAAIIGNTEIITDLTLLRNPLALQWIYRSNNPVIAKTGLDAQHPIVRSVGEILDDRVSVKSYGAIGDGIADDTAAINRALEDLYTVTIPGPFALEMAYRALYFPAGVYKITDYMYLPPHAVLIGDGSTNTVIIQENSSKISVVRTADSLFQNYSDGIGTNSATLPTNIYAEGITFRRMVGDDQDIIHLDLASNVLFRNCGFMGSWVGGASTSSAIYLDNLGVTYTPTNIKFDNCQFLHTNYVLYFDINHGRFATELYFDNCDFDMCNWGIYAITDFQDIKVSNSNFFSISNSALYTALNSSPPTIQNGFVSDNNTYVSCGAPGVAVINFTPGVNTLNCHSLGDTFINSNGPNVSDIGLAVFELSTVNSININNVTISAKQGPIALPGNVTNAPTGITIDLTKLNSAFIDYTLILDNSVRSGRLDIMSNIVNNPSSETLLNDTFAESSPTGITFDYSLTGNILTIIYSSTSVDPASWNIQSKSWLS